MEQFVKQCPQCVKSSIPAREPLLPTPLPTHPWEKVGSDLFELAGITYLLVVDYFSRYLKSSNSQVLPLRVITALKSKFSRHGVPQVLMSDNDPQYDSYEMKEFASTYGFRHITSSPQYPRRNGLGKRMVKMVKKLLKSSLDSYMALLSYRAIPLPWCNLSPSELLMGRKTRTDVQQIASQLTPQWSYLNEFRKLDKELKKKQQFDYNLRHRTKILNSLPDDCSVWVRTGDTQVPGRIVSADSTPRSYYVSTPTGQVRRNCQLLNPRPETLLRDSTHCDAPSDDQTTIVVMDVARS